MIHNYERGDTMAYYLTVQKKKGEYTPLDITKSKYFMRTSNFKGMGMSLEEVDLFTMMFNDEHELRKALFKEKLLEHRYSSSPLSIRLLRNNKYYKVMYDFLYQKDMEYIMDPQLIIRKINDKLTDNDFRFVNAFANNYIKFHECLSTAPEVREFAMDSIRIGKKSNYFNQLDENHDNSLVRMTKLLIYKYNQNSSGIVEYSNQITYRNLHSIIAFVNHYDKKYASEQVAEQISFTEITNSKKKVLKKDHQITGQYSLFE